MYGIVVLHYDALLCPLKVNTLVALSKLPVTLYLSLRSVTDVNLSVFLTPPRPKSPLNTITLLPVFLSSSMPVTSKLPLNGNWALAHLFYIQEPMQLLDCLVIVETHKADLCEPRNISMFYCLQV
jgi:hypothetical protein